MRILTLIEAFLPGNQGGGPVRALDNLTRWVGDHYHFDLLTRNHDYLDASPYAGIDPDCWLRAKQGQICYATDQTWVDIFLDRVAANRPDWIYLNGAFAPMTRKVLRLRQRSPSLFQIPVLVAPHGNLSPVALSRSHWRKRLWLGYAKARGLYADVGWHAASEREAEQIQAVFGATGVIRVVPMAPEAEIGATAAESGEAGARDGKRETTEPCLRLVYFGRLSPEKNLPFAFELLHCFAERHPEVPVIYDLFHLGEIDAQQKKQAAALPTSVAVNFIEGMAYDALQARLRASPRKDSSPAYDALLMPSKTENFSYTVLESLQAGIPVLISDQTPWRMLEDRKIGWDLSLSSKNPWLMALERLAGASEDERHERGAACRRFAADWVAQFPAKAERLFEKPTSRCQ